ncbi:hypothetical protein [Mesorhizobium sp. M1406]|uniref:hypothetical protein n=1 Tax=Mesorhizobium sp. M1406 TaxID=2957099 RepID=UPI00333BFF1C
MQTINLLEMGRGALGGGDARAPGPWLGLVDSFAGKIGAYLVKDWWMALVSRFEILDTSEATVQLSIEMWYDSPHGEEEGKAGD